MSQEKSKRVRELHAMLLPGAVRALIRQRFQMGEDLGYNMPAEAKRQHLSKRVDTTMSMPDFLIVLLEQDDPRDLVAVHASLSMLASEIDETLPIPDMPEGELSLLKFALDRMENFSG